MMKRLKPLVILMFAVLVVSTTAFGEAIAGTATGKFNNSTSTLNFGYLPTGSLVYTGSPFAGTTTQAGDLTPLGSFHLNAPGGNDLFGDDIEGTFTLHLAFT